MKRSEIITKINERLSIDINIKQSTEYINDNHNNYFENNINYLDGAIDALTWVLKILQENK